MSGAGISVAELLEIRSEVEQQALEKHGSRYDDPNRRAPSLERLEAVVAGLPKAGPVERAAWVMRALVLLQPFPDRNNLMGVMAAQLILGRNGINFRPEAEASSAFQHAISEMRYVRMAGYDDAPLSLLSDWHDDMLELCIAFIEQTRDKAPSSGV